MGRRAVAHAHARGAVAPKIEKLEAEIERLKAELAELKATKA